MERRGESMHGEYDPRLFPDTEYGQTARCRRTASVDVEDIDVKLSQESANPEHCSRPEPVDGGQRKEPDAGVLEVSTRDGAPVLRHRDEDSELVVRKAECQIAHLCRSSPPR
jgi:hypothetical protein